MTHKAISSSHIILCLLILVVGTAHATGEEVNEEFVRRSLESFFAEALESLPLVQEERVSLAYTGPSWDDLNVSGSALYSVLRSTGPGLSNKPDSAVGTSLRFRMSEIEFSYENRNGGLFSRGDLYRVLKVAGSFAVSRNQSPIWEDYLIREYRQEIELQDREQLESNLSPLFSAELPPGPVQRFWEPVIVTSIVGGLVYLFFASR